jgi:uncharacterized protein (TIGR00369 family)
MYNKNKMIRLMEEEIPFNKKLGMKVISMEKGSCTLMIPWDESLIGDPIRSAVHGGVISTLIDTAGGAACWSMLEGAEDRLSTVDLRIDYLRRGPPEDLVCEAQVVRMGNRVAVARMELFSGLEQLDNRQTIATGQGVYNIFKPRP